MNANNKEKYQWKRFQNAAEQQPIQTFKFAVNAASIVIFQKINGKVSDSTQKKRKNRLGITEVLMYI